MFIRQEPSRTTPLPAVSGRLAHAVGADAQPDIAHVPEMLAGYEPDDLADLPLGVEGAQSRKCFRAHVLVARQFRGVVERDAFGSAEQRARSVLMQRVEFRLALHRLAQGCPAGRVLAE